MKNQEKIALAVAALLSVSAGMAHADDLKTIVGHKPSGYLLDAEGNVVRSGTGLCWHDGYFEKSMAIVECDPGLMPPPPAAATPAAPAAGHGAAATPAAPTAAAPPPVKRSIQQKVSFGSDELFDFDKATLKPGALVKLDELVGKLKSATELNSITVTGHTDSLGGVAYNQKLSVRRADSVRDYLVAHGVPANKIQTVGKGKSEPIADNKTEEGRAKNRRVDVEVDGYKVVDQ